ncbi:MAG: dicarboxylate/amino acid:cation symporter [Gammaproteobacteria bacterium]|jgi:proton glutamate symport protein
MFRLQLHWQILIALGLAVLVGLAAGPETTVLGVKLHAVLAFFGTLFLNALKMLIVPLVVSSIIMGMSGVATEHGVGRLGLKTLSYYVFTSLLAILIGVLFVNLIQPGVVDGQPAKAILGLHAGTQAITQQVAGHGMHDVLEVFLRMIPVNIVAAAAEGQMLGLIVFSLLVGYFITRLNEPQRGTQASFWQGMLDIMMMMTDLVMRFAPVGVFALVGKVILESGLDAFRPLAVFFLTVLLALAVHFLVVLPLLLRLVGRVNPLRHYRAMLPALLTAFSTSSSSATLPVTMECVEKNAGVSNRTTSFVLPLGATVNMDGTALYECVAALFLAQAYGLHLGFVEQFTVIVLALMTSIGVAGIPAASLVAITIILSSVGLPAEAVGLILAVDRILDMCRTSVNVFSDSCGAVIIARTEGEKSVLQG